MRRGILALALTSIGASIIATPATIPVTTPAKVVTFKDWAVGCDNGLDCQAVALMPETAQNGSLSIVVTRSAGVAGALAIEMFGLASNAQGSRVVIDGKTAYTGTMQFGGKSIKVTGADAMKLARVMAKGTSLRLVDGTGTELGVASLSGASAAFRYADAGQGRTGSRGAIIATGPKKSAGRKTALPVIAVKKIAPSAMLPDAAALVALSESSPCSTQRFGPTEDAAYSLGEGTSGAQALVLLNCGSGAYNFSVGAYVGQRGADGTWVFAPAKFDHAPNRLSENADLALLVNAEWDSATQSLGGYAKGRGIGDCGSSESYVWDGTMFRLTSATSMTECRGSLDWVQVWRADVKLVD